MYDLYELYDHLYSRKELENKVCKVCWVANAFCNDQCNWFLFSIKILKKSSESINLNLVIIIKVNHPPSKDNQYTLYISCVTVSQVNIRADIYVSGSSLRINYSGGFCLVYFIPLYTIIWFTNFCIFIMHSSRIPFIFGTDL